MWVSRLPEVVQQTAAGRAPVSPLGAGPHLGSSASHVVNVPDGLRSLTDVSF